MQSRCKQIESGRGSGCDGASLFVVGRDLSLGNSERLQRNPIRESRNRSSGTRSGAPPCGRRRANQLIIASCTVPRCAVLRSPPRLISSSPFFTPARNSALTHTLAFFTTARTDSRARPGEQAPASPRQKPRRRPGATHKRLPRRRRRPSTAKGCTASSRSPRTCAGGGRAATPAPQRR